jgi:hypothetical protein
MAGLMMFPAMLLGPSIAGTALIAATQGKAGLRSLVLRIYRIGFYTWLATLLIPPGLVIAVLLGLKTYVSPVFKPNLFWIGLLFGCAAGFFEEIGWTGFALPAMHVRQSAMRAGIWLGSMGALARSSHRLSRQRDTTWTLLVPVLSCVRCCNDRRSNVNLLDLFQYQQRSFGADVSCKFDGRPRGIQSFSCHRGSGSNVVRNLRLDLMDDCGNRGRTLWTDSCETKQKTWPVLNCYGSLWHLFPT